MTKDNTCCGYPVHEAAALFPLLPEAELKELADDIKAKGLIYPVVMCGKLVLDGRNRMLACEIAGVGVHFRDYTTYHSEHTPTEWVLAANSKRRQLTASQKGAIGAEATPLIAKEVEEMRRLKISEARNGETRQKIAPSEKDARRATARAAKAVGSNRRYVADAAAIKEKSFEVFEQVKAGKKTISAAKKELGLEPPNQEPDYLEITKAGWLKCTKHQQTEFLTWTRKHRK